ncbi:MAG: hypothetical protein Q4Q18_00190, partial [Methanobrevibacter sp.]|nr:hypothetical protein [Methanobrevibacter sp.]
MKKSKFTILLLFLVMILSISAVSAADTNDTSDSDLQAVDEAPVDEVASTDVGALAATDSSNVLSIGGGNFTELQDAIKHPSGKTVTLNSNYTRVGNEEAIVIEDDIVIEGNGFTIDGNNNGGIFKISKDAILVLQNVIFINGNVENGGAIYNEGNLVISSCQFKNNNASLGGAIYNNGHISTISGSTFENNNATEGLSIYNNGNLSLTGNTINGPIVNTANGKINSDIKVTILDNQVKNTTESRYTLYATITDDNGNLIKQIGENLFKFTVDGQEYGATYDTQLYIASIILTIPDIYTVNVTYSAGNKLIISSQDKNLIYYRGTYTDLLERIGGKSAGQTLDLPYDFTYNPIIDGDKFPNGVVIDKAITIDGKGYTISGSNAYRIFDVTANDVVIRNVTLTKGKANNGGAIFVEASGNLTTDAKFVNNTATNGGAIYTVADITVDNSNFINNTATYGAAINVAGGKLTVSGAAFNENGAVYIATSGNAAISNSVFTSDKVGAINNVGTLALAGNTVKGITNDGTITSEINVLVLKGSTPVYVDGPNVKLYANITDDNKNPISQSGFKFIVNNDQRDATFNENTLLYEAVYTFTSFGNYDVNMTYTGTASNVVITNGTIDYITGTFTDLQRLINNTPAGETLVLPYDFTYDVAFDDGKFPNGVLIDDVITIDGKGHSISGSDANRIFYVTSKATFNNITFKKGKAYDGGAIYATTSIDISNSTFTNDVATRYGGAVCVIATVSNAVVNVENSIFDDNTACQGAIFHQNAKLIVDNSLFNENKAVGFVGGEWASGSAILSYLTSSLEV